VSNARKGARLHLSKLSGSCDVHCQQDTVINVDVRSAAWVDWNIENQLKSWFKRDGVVEKDWGRDQELFFSKKLFGLPLVLLFTLVN
jgi:hypothetical protein